MDSEDRPAERVGSGPTGPLCSIAPGGRIDLNVPPPKPFDRELEADEVLLGQRLERGELRTEVMNADGSMRTTHWPHDGWDEDDE